MNDEPTAQYAECGIDDPKPFLNWLPSPRQIAEFAAQIRREREELQGDSDDDWQ